MFRTRVAGETELGLIEHRHARELFALIEANRAYLRPWMNWVDQRRNQVEVANYIANCMKQFALGQGFYMALWHANKLGGMINLSPIDGISRATPIEYWLAENLQGKGIMTASCRAAMDFAFDTLGLHRLTVRCAVENKRSRAVAERLGFSFEGISRDAEWLHDHFVSHAVYGFLRGDKKPVTSP